MNSTSKENDKTNENDCESIVTNDQSQQSTNSSPINPHQRIGELSEANYKLYRFAIDQICGKILADS